MTLIEVGVLVGGAWGMRMARRAGRSRAAARRAWPPTTPASAHRRAASAPRSIASPIMLSAVAFALGALQCGYAGAGRGPANALVLLAVPVPAGARHGLHGLPPRSGRASWGPCSLLAGLPVVRVLDLPGLPGCGLFDRMLPDDPTAITSSPPACC